MSAKFPRGGSRTFFSSKSKRYMYCENSELLMQLVRFIIVPPVLLGSWGEGIFYIQGAGEHC